MQKEKRRREKKLASDALSKFAERQESENITLTKDSSLQSVKTYSFSQMTPVKPL